MTAASNDTAAKKRSSYCLFQDPWWLDLTTGGDWHEAVVRNGDGVIARLPYRKFRRYGMTVISQPRFTPYAGPWVRPLNAKPSNQFSERRKLTQELLSQLPRCDLFAQNLWPEIPDWLPFHWAGFSQRTGYTNWLRDLSDTKVLWDGFVDVARNEVRKAQKALTVEVSDDVDVLCDFHQRTFEKQGRRPTHERTFLRHVAASAIAAGHGRLSFARDEKNNVHAVCFLVYDDRSAHYVVGGVDDQFRGSGGPSLLVWDAIQFAAQHSALFDFEGSMVETISRFFRSFNATTTPILHVTKTSVRGSLATGLYNLGAALTGRAEWKP